MTKITIPVVKQIILQFSLKGVYGIIILWMQIIQVPESGVLKHLIKLGKSLCYTLEMDFMLVWFDYQQ